MAEMFGSSPLNSYPLASSTSDSDTSTTDSEDMDDSETTTINNTELSAYYSVNLAVPFSHFIHAFLPCMYMIESDVLKRFDTTQWIILKLRFL